MKRLLLSVTIGLLLLVSPAAAAHFWKVDISTPKSLTNHQTFNVEYVSSSTDASDKIKLDLFENEVFKDSQTTDTPYGDSGAFSVTVPNDGTYHYQLRASSSLDGEEAATSTKTVTVVVDTTAPNAPTYAGKSRSGNTYTLTFTAPGNADVAEIRIYSSPSTSFMANASTQVGLVNVSSGETKTFSYTAPDSSERFFALQSFDQTGNFSSLVADQNVAATQGTPAAAGVTATNAAGEVGGEGAATVAANTGTGTTANDTNGDGIADDGQVLGEQTDEGGNNWVWILAIVALVIATYYLAIVRPRRANPTK